MDSEDAKNIHTDLRQGRISLVINTTRPRKRTIEARHIRRMTLMYNVPYCTTIEAAKKMVDALVFFANGRPFDFHPLPV